MTTHGQAVDGFVDQVSDWDTVISDFRKLSKAHPVVFHYSSGQPAERYSYTDEYGAVQVNTPGNNGAAVSPVALANELGCPFRFQGRRYDDESGLYYLRNRYLD